LPFGAAVCPLTPGPAAKPDATRMEPNLLQRCANKESLSKHTLFDYPGSRLGLRRAARRARRECAGVGFTAQRSEVCRPQHADLYNEFVPAASRKISATIKSLGERSKERHTPCVASAPIPHACASGKAECPRCTERRPNRTSEHRPSGSRGQPGRTPPIGVLPGTEAKIAP